MCGIKFEESWWENGAAREVNYCATTLLPQLLTQRHSTRDAYMRLIYSLRRGLIKIWTRATNF